MLCVSDCVCGRAHEKRGMCAAGLLLLSPICWGLHSGIGARWRSCGLINTEALLRFSIQSTLETHGSSWPLLARGRKRRRRGGRGKRGGEEKEGEPQERHSDECVVKEIAAGGRLKVGGCTEGKRVCRRDGKRVEVADRPGVLTSQEMKDPQCFHKQTRERKTRKIRGSL